MSGGDITDLSLENLRIVDKYIDQFLVHDDDEDSTAENLDTQEGRLLRISRLLHECLLPDLLQEINTLALNTCNQMYYSIIGSVGEYHELPKDLKDVVEHKLEYELKIYIDEASRTSSAATFYERSFKERCSLVDEGLKLREKVKEFEEKLNLKDQQMADSLMKPFSEQSKKLKKALHDMDQKIHCTDLVVEEAARTKLRQVMSVVMNDIVHKFFINEMSPKKRVSTSHSASHEVVDLTDDDYS